MRCLRFLLRVQLQGLSILASFSFDLTIGLFTPQVLKLNSTAVSKSVWEEVFGKGGSDLEVASLNNTWNNQKPLCSFGVARRLHAEVFETWFNFVNIKKQALFFGSINLIIPYRSPSRIRFLAQTLYVSKNFIE